MEKDNRRKIIHIIGNARIGGVAAFLLNYFGNIDREKYRFDFVTYGESEFDEGLSDYVTSKGYSLTYSSAKSGGNIDYAAVKSAINSQRPVLVFTETADFYGQETRVAGGSTFHREFSVASHIFLINGYMKITYNKGLSSERELIIYESVSLKTAESCIIMGDAPVYNAKGVNIS